MHPNEVATLIVDERGLLKRGLRVERQRPIPLVFDGMRFEESFRADLIVEGIVVVEIKAIDQWAPVHRRKLLTYLKLLDLRLGLIVNFGAPLIKDGITRVVNGLEDEPARAASPSS